jgi:hypothetical protein
MDNGSRIKHKASKGLEQVVLVRNSACVAF